MPSITFHANTGIELSGPGRPWLTPENATGMPNGTDAVSSLFGVVNTNWLRLRANPASRIPASASIIGLLIRAIARYTAARTVPVQANYRIVSGNTTLGASTPFGPISPTYVWLSAGDSQSIPGGISGLTPEQVNAAFGIDFMASGIEEEETDVGLDAVEFSVWYSMPQPAYRSSRIGIHIGI